MMKKSKKKIKGKKLDKDLKEVNLETLAINSRNFIRSHPILSRMYPDPLTGDITTNSRIHRKEQLYISR